MRRGEIWLVDLEPVRGSEANKTRPVVVVSGDARNRAAEKHRRGVITVVPLTSSTVQVFPFQALVVPDAENGLTVESKAQAEQVRAVDYERFIARRGCLDSATMEKISQALILHLDL